MSNTNNDATRGCTVAYCELHAEIEIVPGEFCPACLATTCRADGMRDGLSALRASRDALSARVARLEAALRFYADRDNWIYGEDMDGQTFAVEDCGEKARAALEDKP